MDTRIAAYAVIERKGEILLTHWRRERMNGWTLPGGGIEPGEDPKDAAKREVYEETGLNAKIGKLLGVDSRVFSREDAPEGVDPRLHTIRIVYRATVEEAPLRHEENGSSDEARWVPISELPKYRTLALVGTALRMAGIRSPLTSRKRKRRRKPRPSGQTQATNQTQHADQTPSND